MSKDSSIALSKGYKQVRAIFLIIATLAGVATAYLAYTHYSSVRQSRERVIAAMGKQVTHLADSLNTSISFVEGELAALAQQLEGGNYSDAEVDSLIMQLYHSRSGPFGYSISFAPQAHGTDARHIRYYRGVPGVPDSAYWMDTRAFHDYTAFFPDEPHRTDWWRVPMEKDQAMWNEPFFGKISRSNIMIYSQPFHLPAFDQASGGKPAGILGAVFDDAYFANVLNTKEYNGAQTDYSFIVSAQGHFISHPVTDYMEHGRPLDDRESPDEVEVASQIKKLVVAGQAGHVEYENPITGRQAWVFIAPMQNTGWALAVVVDTESTQPPNQLVRRRLINLLILALITLGTLASGIFMAQGLTWGEAQWLSIIYSLLLTLGIAGIWMLGAQYPDLAEEMHGIVADRASLDAQQAYYTKEYRLNNGDSAELPIIPTGVYMKSIEFISSTNVQVSGYVWQKFPLNNPAYDHLEPGFTLPEANGAEITEAYDRIVRPDANDSTKDYRLYGWQFDAEIRQQFDYSQYPGDRQQVWLRLWSTNFDETLLLVPDINAYLPTINPLTLPGLADDIVLPGYTIERCFFNYWAHDYSTNFGLGNYEGGSGMPELYYNVEFKREFLGPFISKVIPVLVSAIMMFALLVTVSSKRLELTGFSVNNIVLGVAALFFVIVFEHINLRNTLESARVLYFEYYYFALYIIMIVVMINSILYLSQRGSALTEIQDNLIAKLLYWPLYLIIIFGATFMVFR